MNTTTTTTDDIAQRVNDFILTLRQQDFDDKLIDKYANLPGDVAIVASANNLTEASFILRDKNPELASFLYSAAQKLWLDAKKLIQEDNFWEEKIVKNEELSEMYNSFMSASVEDYK